MIDLHKIEASVLGILRAVVVDEDFSSIAGGALLLAGSHVASHWLRPPPRPQPRSLDLFANISDDGLNEMLSILHREKHRRAIEALSRRAVDDLDRSASGRFPSQIRFLALNPIDEK